MTTYRSADRLIIFDVDGTIVDAFSAIDEAFVRNDMDIGDLERFQKRRKIFKYLGGLKEFPVNLKKQLRKQGRKKILSTLTEIYREEASMYPGLAELIQALIAKPGIRVGMVTRNVTIDPMTTLGLLFERHEIDLKSFDFVAHVPLGMEKTGAFRTARKQFEINPAKSHACGDEHKDFAAAIGAGMHPFIVSYGFEDFERLTGKFDIPEEIISRSPQELCARVRHALDIGQP